MSVQPGANLSINPAAASGAKRRWKSVVHALHVMVRCIDCGCADHQVLAAGERGACNTCGSTRVELSSAEVLQSI
jgi:hypothetical protein